MRRFGVICLGMLCAGAALASSAAANEYPVTALPQVGRCINVGKGNGEWTGPTCTALNTINGGYKWEEGAGASKKFSGVTETTTFETTGGKKIVCAATLIEGEYNSAKIATFKNDSVGCTLASTKQSCQTSPVPQKEGEVEISAGGEIGFIRVVKPLIGWDLKGVNVTVTCGKFPETNITVVKIEGSVIGSVAKTGKMLLEEKLKFKQSGGKQNPEHFEGEPTDVLTSEWTEGLTKTTEQMGLAAIGEYENEEPIEIKTKCNFHQAPCT